MKKTLTFIVLFSVLVGMILWLPWYVFEDQELVQITHELEDLPTNDVQIVLQADDISSFELSLDEFKNRQFKGISSLEVKRSNKTGQTSTAEVTMYASESGTTFHVQLENIEMSRWSLWGVNMGSYFIVDQTLDDGVLTLSLERDMGLLLLFMIGGLGLGLILISTLINRIWPDEKNDLSRPTQLF